MADRRTRTLLVISMNDQADAALQVGTEPLYGGIELDTNLQRILGDGLTVREGAVLFACFRETLPVNAGQVAQAIERMGWRNLTTYQCQHNSFYLEDDAMQQGELNEDDVACISEADQLTLLRRRLLVARQVCNLARNLPEAVPVRCIISANETTGNFRFRQLRDGEDWISNEVDGYKIDKVVLVDSRPPGRY